MSLVTSQDRWAAFTWGPALALYDHTDNDWKLLDCKAAAATAVAAPDAAAAAAKPDADGDADADDADDGDSKKAKDSKDGKGAGAAAAVMHVRVIKFSPDGQYLASGGDDKVLCVWHTRTGRCLATIRAKKRISAVTFVPAPTPTLLFGDRVGDVYQAALPALAVPAPALGDAKPKKAAAAAAAAGPAPVDIPNPTLVFGHLAALTELVFVPSPAAGANATAGYVLSSDDEAQVRVSQYPHVFDIQSFCLHHTGFISALTAVSPAAVAGTPVPRAVSGGGDAVIVLWNLHTGAKLATYSFDPASSAANGAGAGASAAGAAASAVAVASANAAKLFSRDALEKGGAVPSFDRYVSSIAYSKAHDLLAVAVNTVPAVYLFDVKANAFTLVETLPLPSHTCGVSVVAEGPNFVVSTRRIPDAPVAPEKGKAQEPAPVLGVDPLLSVFVPRRQAGAAAAAGSAPSAATRFMACDSKMSASVQVLNGHFAALMSSSPAPCDLPSDDYAQRERAKRAKFLDAATKKDERLRNKVDRKVLKKQKKAAAKAVKDAAKAAANANADGDGAEDMDADDG